MLFDNQFSFAADPTAENLARADGVNCSKRKDVRRFLLTQACVV